MEPSPAAPYEAHPTASAGIGEFNRAIAWSGFAAGAGMGLIMGMWSFDGPVAVPALIGEYGDTARRLLRLGHIALFGLGILNLLLVRNLPTLPLGQRPTRAALACMNFGNVFLPLVLIGAALLPGLKYLMALPALGVFAALCLAAAGAWSHFRIDRAGRIHCAETGRRASRDRAPAFEGESR